MGIEGIVIVGAGAAGHAAARTLRAEGWSGPISLVSDENDEPYNRTLVGKGVLPGLLDPAQIALPSLTADNVEVVRGRAVGIEPAERLVRVAALDGGGVRPVPYAALIVTVGASPRRTAAHPAHPAGPYIVHTLADALALRARLVDIAPATPVAVLGAGFVGSEIASVLAEESREVMVIARSRRPLSTAVGDAISERLALLHEDAVNARLGANVMSVTPVGDRVEITLDTGEKVTAGAIVMAHGTLPAIDWIGQGHRAGIAVDDRMRAVGLAETYAAGSGAIVPLPHHGTGRLDHWDSATEQGAHAARALLHDLGLSADPGAYHPATAWSLRLHGQTITGYGITPRNALQKTTADGASLLTEFLAADTRELVGVVGLGATRAVLATRSRLA